MDNIRLQIFKAGIRDKSALLRPLACALAP